MEEQQLQALTSNLGFATITKKRLAPKRCIVLQQIIDVPDPIILFSGPNAFLAWLFVSIIGYGGAVNARHWVWRSLYSNGLPWIKNMRHTPVH
jgi:hypothetical protein